MSQRSSGPKPRCDAHHLRVDLAEASSQCRLADRGLLGQCFSNPAILSLICPNHHDQVATYRIE